MKFGKSIFVAMFVALTVCCSFSASAAEEECWVMRPIEKLGRGIANVAFGALELPMKWVEVTEDQGAIAGLTYGTLKGVGFVIARVVVGVVDVATFFMPLPDCPEYPDDAGWGYGPIMKPAWVVPVGSDWNNFVYSNEGIINPSR